MSKMYSNNTKSKADMDSVRALWLQKVRIYESIYICLYFFLCCLYCKSESFNMSCRTENFWALALQKPVTPGSMIYTVFFCLINGLIIISKYSLKRMKKKIHVSETYTNRLRLTTYWLCVVNIPLCLLVCVHFYANGSGEIILRGPLVPTQCGNIAQPSQVQIPGDKDRQTGRWRDGRSEAALCRGFQPLSLPVSHILIFIAGSFTSTDSASESLRMFWRTYCLRKLC